MAQITVITSAYNVGAYIERYEAGYVKIYI